MSQLIELLLELSVVNMALSFLLINRIVEAERKEPALVKGHKKYTIAYFILLFATAIISLLILILNEFYHYLEECWFLDLISIVLVATPFVIALSILFWLIYEIYKITPYLQEHEELLGKSIKKDGEE